MRRVPESKLPAKLALALLVLAGCASVPVIEETRSDPPTLPPEASPAAEIADPEPELVDRLPKLSELPPDAIGVQGRITAPDGSPLERVQIWVVRDTGDHHPRVHPDQVFVYYRNWDWLSAKGVSTDAQGRYAVVLEPGAYWVLIAAEGRAGITRKVVVSDAPVDLQAELHPASRLCLTLIGEDETPVRAFVYATRCRTATCRGERPAALLHLVDTDGALCTSLATGANRLWIRPVDRYEPVDIVVDLPAETMRLELRRRQRSSQGAAAPATLPDHVPGSGASH